MLRRALLYVDNITQVFLRDAVHVHKICYVIISSWHILVSKLRKVFWLCIFFHPSLCKLIDGLDLSGSGRHSEQLVSLLQVLEGEQRQRQDKTD